MDDVRGLLDVEAILLLSSFVTEQTEPITNAISIGSEAHQLVDKTPSNSVLHDLFLTWQHVQDTDVIALSDRLRSLQPALRRHTAIQEELAASLQSYCAWCLRSEKEGVATSVFALCSAVVSLSATDAFTSLVAESLQSHALTPDAARLSCYVTSALSAEQVERAVERVCVGLLRGEDVCESVCRLLASDCDCERLRNTAASVAPQRWSESEVEMMCACMHDKSHDAQLQLARDALQRATLSDTSRCDLLCAALQNVDALSIQPLLDWRTFVAVSPPSYV